MASSSSAHSSKIRIAVLYPTDPAGHVPSGIDSFIRGILKWAPQDLEYTLFGATSDACARPVGTEVAIKLGDRLCRFIPLVAMDASGKRSLVPLTVRYMWALRRFASRGGLSRYDILDFHRIEPVWLFKRDPRPKNVVLHQDMTVIRDRSSDIMWRHAPWLYEAMEHGLLAAVRQVLSVRQSAVERYARLYPDLAAKFSFIPTWVDTAVFRSLTRDQSKSAARRALLRRLGAADAARCVLAFVGRLDSQKDPLLLVRAFSEILKSRMDLHLVMIGDGNLRPRVEKAVQDGLLRGRVTLLGVRPAAEIAEVLRASDLFVLSSAYEGMPIALLEALACGIPVVTTDVGEVRRVVQDGITGRISRERTPEAFAAAMGAALDELPSISGEPCVQSVVPYQPETVLGQIFALHRSEMAVHPAEAMA